VSIETLLNCLNEHQRAATTFENEHALVLAGAGAGKTATIVARAAYLIHKGIPAHRIYILTFTRRAASELVHRVKLSLGAQAEGLRASTFHTFCMSMIHRAPNLFGVKGYSVIDRDDQVQLFRMVRGGKTIKNEKIATAATICDIYSFARNTGKSLTDTLAEGWPDELANKEKLVAIMKEYQARKAARKYLDYDDILDVVVHAMDSQSEVVDWIANQYSCLLVDELQDTNPLQWKLLDPLKDRCKIFGVGDDAQSIYKFRGADFQNIHSFSKRVPSSKLFKLQMNYRSTQEILDVSNWVLAQSPVKYDKHLVAARGAGNKPQLHNFPNEWEEATVFCQDIIRRHTDLGDDWRDHMILTRSAYGAKAMESALLAAEIPYRFIGGTKLLESAHVRDMLSLVRIVGNPTDELAMMRYLTLFPGVGEVTAHNAIQGMLKADGLLEAVESLRCARKIPPAAVEGLLAVLKVQHSVADAITTAISAIEGILEQKYLSQDWAKRKRDFPIVAKLAEKHTSILAFIEEYVLDPIHVSTVSDDPTKDDVTLITVHSAKGTECKTTYVLNVSPGTYPSRLDLGSIEDVEESRRVLYVALTRAKDNLIVGRRSTSYWAYAAVDGEDISGYFLNELPAGLFEEVEHGPMPVPHAHTPSGVAGYSYSGGVDLG